MAVHDTLGKVKGVGADGEYSKVSQYPLVTAVSRTSLYFAVHYYASSYFVVLYFSLLHERGARDRSVMKLQCVRVYVC